jgi:iron(III) transport system ATP-binding protein
MVGLHDLGRRYPHQLSGGQQQRVALARALAIDPALVLLDEPFSALDASLRASVRADVRRVLRAAGTTALLVTHDQEEALSLADAVAVIGGGRIGQCDTPTALYRAPSSPDLARALGEANLLEGTVRGTSVLTELGSLQVEGAVPAEGSAVVVLVRPEQIALVEEPSAPRGRLVDFEYYGHDAVVRLVLEGGGTSLTARTTRTTESLQPGMTLAVRVDGPVVAWPAPLAPAGALAGEAS